MKNKRLMQNVKVLTKTRVIEMTHLNDGAECHLLAINLLVEKAIPKWNMTFVCTQL